MLFYRKLILIFFIFILSLKAYTDEENLELYHFKIPSKQETKEENNKIPLEKNKAAEEEPEEETNKNIVSETFAPKEEEEEKRDFKDSLSSLSENYSWIFDSKKTTQEVAIAPTYYMSRTYGPNWGLRFFTFSPDNSGYYLSTALINQLFSPLFKWDINHRQIVFENQEIRTYGQFSNYFEPYHEEKGMNTVTKDEKKLYTYKFILEHQMLFKEFQPLFFGGKIGTLFLKERAPYLEDEKRSAREFLVYLKLIGGYDSRSNWENPKSGQHHQLAFTCVPMLESSSYCLADIDLRAYIPIYEDIFFFRNPVIALRGFAGTSLIAPPSYSMAYRLGGSHVFRGFTANRFRGDKIYLTQSELRTDLWKDIVSGVLFLEMGEVAEYGKPFSGFLWSYGLGFRFGIPPSYNVKFRIDLGFSKDRTGKRSYNLIMNFFQAF